MSDEMSSAGRLLAMPGAGASSLAVWRVCRLRLPASLQPGVGVDDVLPLRAHDLVHTVDLVAQLVEHFQAGVGIAAAANLCSGEDKG